MANNPLIDKLFSVGAHFGYAPSRRHPSQAAFIYGTKGGTELFDLEKTAVSLEEALQFVKRLASERKAILFVGGKAEARGALVRVAERLNQPYSAGRWIGGTLTNFSEIRKRLNKLQEHTDMREKGELAKFTKHERLLIDREITELENMFGGLRGMQKTPDALFVVDPKHEAMAVTEAHAAGLPVIAIMNSDCDRTKITYPIPANDASIASISLILEEVSSAYLGSLPSEPAAPAEVTA